MITANRWKEMETGDIVRSIKVALDVFKDKVEDSYPDLEEKEKADVRASVVDMVRHLVELLETINNADVDAMATM